MKMEQISENMKKWLEKTTFILRLIQNIFANFGMLRQKLKPG